MPEEKEPPTLEEIPTPEDTRMRMEDLRRDLTTPEAIAARQRRTRKFLKLHPPPVRANRINPANP